MVVGARPSLQFFRQKILFVGNNRDLSKLKYWTLHYLIVIIKLQNNQHVKSSFILTTRVTLIYKTLIWSMLKGAPDTKYPIKLWICQTFCLTLLKKFLLKFCQFLLFLPRLLSMLSLPICFLSKVLILEMQQSHIPFKWTVWVKS